MNNQLAPEEILKHFEENADYQWLCTNISLLSESIRTDYHIDSLLYYVDSLREALLANSSELKYYRHFECYAEILHTISSKVQLQLYGTTTFEEQTSFEEQTNPAPKKKKDGNRLSKKIISDEKVQCLYADAIKDINSMQMDIFDFIQADSCAPEYW